MDAVATFLSLACELHQYTQCKQIWDPSELTGSNDGYVTSRTEWQGIQIPAETMPVPYPLAMFL
jgi:hypothetical protein